MKPAVLCMYAEDARRRRSSFTMELERPLDRIDAFIDSE
jgi:hypothetical protein